MALVDYEGFDTFTDVATPGMFFPGAQGVISALGDGVFNYGRFWRTNGILDNPAGRDFSNRQEVFANFHFRVDILGTVSAPFFAFVDGTTIQIGVRVNPTTGVYELYRGTTLIGSSAAVYPIGGWVFLQLHTLIDPAVGFARLYVNGNLTPAIDFNGNTRQTANNFVNRWRVGRAFSNATIGTPSALLDNVVIYDPAPGSPNSLTPETRIYFSLPTDPGFTTQWTPSAGANWQNVNENPPNGDTTFNSAGAVGLPLLDLYEYPNNTVPGLATVYGVGERMLVRKDDAGVNEVDFVIRSGGSNYSPGVPIPLTSTYTTYRFVWTLNPNGGGAWDAGLANAVQMGIVRIT